MCMSCPSHTLVVPSRPHDVHVLSISYSGCSFMFPRCACPVHLTLWLFLHVPVMCMSCPSHTAGCSFTSPWCACPVHLILWLFLHVMSCPSHTLVVPSCPHDVHVLSISHSGCSSMSPWCACPVHLTLWLFLHVPVMFMSCPSHTLVVPSCHVLSISHSGCSFMSCPVHLTLWLFLHVPGICKSCPALITGHKTTLSLFFWVLPTSYYRCTPAWRQARWRTLMSMSCLVLSCHVLLRCSVLWPCRNNFLLQWLFAFRFFPTG